MLKIFCLVVNTLTTVKMQPLGGKVQLPLNVRDLPARIVEAFRSIYKKSSIALFFLLRHLRGYTLFRFGRSQTVSSDQALQLNFRPAPYDDQVVEAPVSARFDHQRRVDDRNAVWILSRALSKPTVLLVDHQRVNDRI